MELDSGCSVQESYQTVPYKMMIFYNGTVSKGATYKDICSEHKESNSMVELKKIGGVSSMKVMIWEIYKSFFENNKISPSFIYANYTHDLVDEDTGKKIGPMGTVSHTVEKKT